MPKRKTNPLTGERQLTYREQRFVDEFFSNGGNGAKAAGSAGYTAARADQAAYQVLRRQQVQQRIRERIRDSQVTADEIIGTLVSHMRADLTEFFDASGNFSIQVAREKGLGHLLKSISGTICDNPQPPANSHNSPAPDHQPPTTGASSQSSNVQTCKRCNAPRPFRVQLHSPLQAAAILARIQGVDRSRPYHRRPHDKHSQTCRDFDPDTLLESLIQEQVKEHGLSREAVTNLLLQVRPEFAKYLQELPPPTGSADGYLDDDLNLRDRFKLLAVVLDSIASLKSTQSTAGSPDPSPDPGEDGSPEKPGPDPRQAGSQHPSPDPSEDGSPDLSESGSIARVVDAYQQIQAMTPVLAGGVISPDNLDDAVRRISARLSRQERKRLVRLQVRCLIHDRMRLENLTEAEALDAIRAEAKVPDVIHTEAKAADAIRTEAKAPDAIRRQAADLPATQPSPPPETVEQCGADSLPASPPVPPPDHRPQTPDSLPSVPTQDSRLRTQDSLRPDPAVISRFNQKYDCIKIPYLQALALGTNDRFVEMIRDIMKDETLTAEQALDAMRLEARSKPWYRADRIEQCIADYTALHPRLSQRQPQSSPAEQAASPQSSTSTGASPEPDLKKDISNLSFTQLLSDDDRPP